jgi:hypothetical protein
MNDDKKENILEPIGALVFAAALLLSLALFFSLSKAFFMSFLGAVISAALIWISYITLRICFFASKK